MVPIPSGVQVPKLELPDVMPYTPQLHPRQGSGERLSILYLVHSFYPESYAGTEKFVHNVAMAMHNKGHRVKVVAYSHTIPDDHPKGMGSIVFDDYIHEGIPVIAYKSRVIDPALRFYSGDADCRAFAESILQQERPSILHIGHPMRALEFTEAAQRLGIPYIITLTDYWFLCPKSIMLQKNGDLCSGPQGGAACRLHCSIDNVDSRLANHAAILQSASRILSPSSFLAAMTKSNLPAYQVEVLPHGIRQESVAPNRKKYRKRSSITLLYGGAIGGHKGVHVLINAMKRVPSPRLKLLIYGSGSPAYMEEMQHSASRDSRILFRGTYTDSDLVRIYQEADVAVVPSVWYENYPLALHEALASRVPVLVSHAGGMSEKVADGVNGFTFGVNNDRQLAVRLRLLLKYPKLLNVMKRNICRMTLPTVEQEAFAYETIYFTHAR